ncbi:hypothetical protein CTI12_AA088220 [Artemisia annua]|uniref:Uncharacterized protein n=1 Tax=Artemisia annua TaxID=35608 RepID=A0A2U1Q1A5_ARTAN|nr:hypothetical protein CTI12_AA088220 [Artemisia annua]
MNPDLPRSRCDELQTKCSIELLEIRNINPLLKKTIPKELHLEGDGHTRHGQCIETTFVAPSDMDQRTYMEKGLAQAWATNPEYVVTTDDVDKLIAVECIPIDEQGCQGEIVILVKFYGAGVPSAVLMKHAPRTCNLYVLSRYGLISNSDVVSVSLEVSVFSHSIISLVAIPDNVVKDTLCLQQVHIRVVDQLWGILAREPYVAPPKVHGHDDLKFSNSDFNVGDLYWKIESVYIYRKITTLYAAIMSLISKKEKEDNGVVTVAGSGNEDATVVITGDGDRAVVSMFLHEH